ncbi:hypothetical protein NDU88_007616 [Pleurodeles waltl]|uniref:Uncharacterized protein n=1 Tax=Pleurodeles waltl TaxID=8319 RepID=A0AAV7QL62_PLEWA|nr:hypothetical protein NDU88_007616 [Pleurodeles waltl]
MEEGLTTLDKTTVIVGAILKMQECKRAHITRQIISTDFTPTLVARQVCSEIGSTQEENAKKRRTHAAGSTQEEHAKKRRTHAADRHHKSKNPENKTEAVQYEKH